MNLLPWKWFSKIEKKALSFEGADTFIGDGTNPNFGQPQNVSEELFGKPTVQRLEELASSHPIVRRCIGIKATSVLEAPLKKGQRVEDGWEDSPNDDEDLTRLRRPNPLMRFPEFIYRTILNLDATGFSFWWVWRTRLGIPAEIWPMPTSWVRQVPLKDLTQDDDRRVVDHYEIIIPGTSVMQVSCDDIISSKIPDCRNFIGAAAPLANCWRNVQMDITVGDYSAELYRNSRLPGMVFKQENQFTDQQKNQIRRLFDDFFSVGRRGRPIFMGGKGAEISQLDALGDLGYPNVSSLNETRICMALGVPPILVGCWAGLMNSPWINIGEARKIFAYYTMTPLWIQLEEMFSELVESPYEFYFDRSQVAALQPDQGETAKKAESLLNSSMISRNEAREMIGEDPDEVHGDVYLMPMSLQEVPIAEPLAAAESPAAGPPPSDLITTGQPSIASVAANTGKLLRLLKKGGEGSGYFDHAGRPGEVGGSAPNNSGREKPNSIKLYRAASDDFARPGTSFGESLETAKAYQNNPGFGGPDLYAVTITPENLIDLSDKENQWDTLSEIIGEKINPENYAYQFARTLTANDEIISKLASAGYDWVKFTDDFPEGSITWVPLSDDAADNASENMGKISKNKG